MNWDANPTKAPIRMFVSGKDPSAVYAVGPYYVAVRGATADDPPEVVYQERSRVVAGVRGQFYHLLVEAFKAVRSEDLVSLVNVRTGPDLFGDVGAFHSKFNLPAYPSEKPHVPARDVLRFRIEFMQEELAEFSEACQAKNLADAADALADLVWVALGTAHLMGIPFDDVWSEVRRANMEKERARGADDPRSKRKHSLDVVKPAGWRPPDHGPALAFAAENKKVVVND